MVSFKTFIALTIAALGTTVLLAVSPDQTNLGILIDENRLYIKYINTVISNLAGPQPKAEKTADGKESVPEKKLDNPYFELFSKINQADFNGNMWYMQSNYRKSSKQLHDAQALLKDIYQISLEQYKEQARAMLEAAAPMIIRSNDAIAKQLLHLGFRDLKSGEDFYTIGFNSAPYQHRYKLNVYIDGIKVLRRARRFAILAMIAAKTPNEDKAEFKEQTLDDFKKTVTVENISDYERIRNTITNYVDNRLLEQKIVPTGNSGVKPIDLLEVHDDNYGYITYNRISLLEESNLRIKKNDANEKESLPPRPDEVKSEPVKQ